MLVLKWEKLTFSGLTWIPEQSLQTQVSGLACGQRHTALWKGKGMGKCGCRTPLVPAHFLKEPGIAITVCLLGPQDVGEFEGLAVLLLGSLDVVLWRAEEEAVRNEVLRGH